jgi:hypothetical protein
MGIEESPRCTRAKLEVNEVEIDGEGRNLRHTGDGGDVFPSREIKWCHCEEKAFLPIFSDIWV